MSIESPVISRSYQRSGFQAPRGLSRERLVVKSGVLVIIDQFMLANKQFISMVNGADAGPAQGNVDASTESPLFRRVRAAVVAYGGCVLQVEPVQSEVVRDPVRLAMLVCTEGTTDEFDGANGNVDESASTGGDVFDVYLPRIAEFEVVGRVFVDTRCVAFIDAALLLEPAVTNRFAALRRGGDDKAARDFIRDRGGAVRYGFQRYGDELAVRHLRRENCVLLTPDVVD